MDRDPERGRGSLRQFDDPMAAATSELSVSAKTDKPSQSSFHT